MYLTDDEIRHIVRSIYDWTDDTSTLAFYLQPADMESEEGRKVDALYRSMGDQLHFRSLAQFKDLFKPWVADSLGFRTMEEWHGVESPLTEEDYRTLPEGVTGYGAYLIKAKGMNGNGHHT